MRINSITPKYVERMPEKLLDGILYISLKYKIAIHLCCCGCGGEAVTPLNPVRGWILTDINEKVSLNHSIGNQKWECRSHYSIKNNEVIWYES